MLCAVSFVSRTGVDVDHATTILVQLFAILVATKVGHEIFRRIGQPPVVGEILGGVVAGPAVLGVYQINGETTLFAEIGVVLLLFQVGVETRLHELLRVGPTAVAVAVLGVIVPFAGGFLAAELAGGDLVLAVFLAAALTATSVGITSNVLRDLGALNSRAGRIILGAAIIDDVLAIMILSVATGVAAGSVDAISVGSLIVVAMLFIVVVVVGGTRIVQRRRSLLTDPAFADGPLLPGMIVMLGLAALASAIGLAAIIGAFLAGLVAGESDERDALEAEVAPVAAFFTPFFFGFIGAQVDLAGLANIETLGLLAGITDPGDRVEVHRSVSWRDPGGSPGSDARGVGHGAARRGRHRGGRVGPDDRRDRGGDLLGRRRDGDHYDPRRPAPASGARPPLGTAWRIVGRHTMTRDNPSDLTVVTMGILWFSALASAIVDNIPYTATAIPVVQQLADTGLEAEPMWWALALGACLGGDLTIVGASATIVVANLAARDGHPIAFMQFFRYGLGVVVASLLISTVYLWVRYL